MGGGENNVSSSHLENICRQNKTLNSSLNLGS